MKVTYFQNTDGGCDFYRAILPIETANINNVLKAKKIFSHAMMGYYHYDRDKFDQDMQCDVFFTQRIGSVSFLNSLKQYVSEYKSNSKIVMDFDDNVFKVSPLSNHYADYGIEDVCLKFPDGTEHWAWKDGQNINLKRNKQTLDEIKRNLESVDMVTTTTEILADVFRQYNPNVRVLPNCVDASVWTPIEGLKSLRKNKDEIRIFWAGGQSHWEDFLVVREALKEIVDKYKNVKLVIMGWVPPGFKEFYGEEKVEFHPWVDTVAYPYKMKTMDVDFGIIPLKDTEFNRCKSPIKWIEMGSLHIPTVCSLVSPYKEMVGLSTDDNGVYIENNDAKSWVKGITYMIENEGARRDMGASARKVVEGNFDINTQYHQWANAFQEAMLCQSPQHQQ